MSDYIRVYNLTVKDSLPTGDSGKVIKGTELDVELNAVAAAISSKSDSNSPTFTGIPAGPTATYGTNTTQLATTAFVQAALQAMYPVGSVYINATVATNPATLLGFGTWTAIGAGKVLVGQDTSDADFDVLGDTGGSKSSIASHTHTFTSGTESTSHTHGVSGSTGGQSADHTHGAWTGGSDNGTGSSWAGPNKGYAAPTTGTSNDHSHSFSVTSGTTSSTHTHSGTTASTGTNNGNLQPFVTVKMWQRTA